MQNQFTGDVIKMDWDLFVKLYIIFWMFLLGSVMGSFLDCLADRLVDGQSPLNGRSHCNACGHVLLPRDLIPIISFLVSKGRCRYCKHPIPKECLLSELVMALVFLALGLKIDMDSSLIMYAIFSCVLFTITLIDWKTHVIPNKALVVLLLNRLFFFVFFEEITVNGILQIIIGACCVSVPMLFISIGMDYILKKESMGGGDIKLLFVIGMYMSWLEMLLLIFIACVLALLYFFFIPNKDEQVEIPFGPFLSGAWFLVFLFGERFLQWYQSLLF